MVIDSASSQKEIQGEDRIKVTETRCNARRRAVATSARSASSSHPLSRSRLGLSFRGSHLPYPCKVYIIRYLEIHFRDQRMGSTRRGDGVATKKRTHTTVYYSPNRPYNSAKIPFISVNVCFIVILFFLKCIIFYFSGIILLLHYICCDCKFILPKGI